MTKVCSSRLRLTSCVAFFFVATVVSRCGTPLFADEPKPREPWTGSKLRGAPTPPEPFRIVTAFPDLKFDHPTCLQQIPGTNRMLVTEIGGRVLSFVQDAGSKSAELAIDLNQVANGHVSLFSAVLHPKFEQNRFVYLCMVRPDGGSHTRVSRFTMTKDAVPTIDPQSETVIITWPSGGHNAGCLRFGKDGMLYISTGDGSGPNPPDGLTTGQDVSDLLGAILRIDVDHPDAGRSYTVPRDNPFVGNAGARPEIFAYGLRNPWKFGIDRTNGEVFVADNGWETWELIYLAGSGTNCGWPIMEGRARLRSEVTPGPTPITPPIRDHHHSEANSVIGGPVYRGSRLKALQGEFVYGDYITGTIWSVGRAADGSFVGRTLVDTDLQITDFLEGASGELFVVDYDVTGQIYELLPNDVEDLSASFPRLLSKTGLFESLLPLQPTKGVARYDVTSPQWSDGAVAERFVAIPGSATIELPPNSGSRGVWPEGTVLAKHLAIPKADGGLGAPLETQVLLFQQGVWSPYVYRWNDQGTDAELVGSGGAERPVEWPDQKSGKSEVRTWRTGATNECRLCHNAGAGSVLGFIGNQLASSSGPGKSDSDQLKSLLAQGVISSIPSDPKTSAWKLVDPHDETADLNDRARSYLHGNCSMCHHVGGNAIVSFFVTRDLPFERMNTNKGTGIGTFGLHDAKIIASGDPYRSLMLYRMSKLGYARMPYIGSQVVDSAGVSLIDRWIRSLPSEGAAVGSSPLNAESSESRALATLTEKNAGRDRREGAIGQLVKSSEGALALASRLHAATLADGVREGAVNSVRNAGSDVRGLFDAFVPESQRKKTLGRTFEPSVVLNETGDAERGRLIFFSDTARCRACHHADDPAASVGPTLKEISKKYPQRAELLQHVIEPSSKVEEKFSAWALATTDGQILSGLLDSQTNEQVVLKLADGKRATIAKKDIDDLRMTKTSLMPEGVLADLSPGEAADLLSFIGSIAGGTR